MRLINRFGYLMYYLGSLDLKKLRKNLSYASQATGRSKIRLLTDSVNSVFRYNTSLTDYFSFRFFSLKEIERSKWAGTGFMYEYQLGMNPKGAREVLENKIRFLHHFKPFLKREFHSLDEIINDQRVAEKMLASASGRIVLKGSRGQVGAEVEVINCDGLSPSILIRHMTEKKFDLVEEFVVQHESLMALSPSGLNTVRVFTQLNKDNVEFLGARLRISVNSPVDNMAAGNLAAPVDIVSGIVNGPAVFSDITKEDKSVHPVTGITITGFVIPYWKEVIELTRKAALFTPENRSVGWDVAITKEGPELIEGNHNWCKLLWQLPVKQGLKAELEKYL